MTIGSERHIPCPGAEEHYLLSEYGRVYSLRSKKYLKPYLNSAGYYVVCLYGGGPKKPSPSHIHRLVALGFVEGRTKNKDVVCHMDGDKLNNCPSNLYWGNASENALDSVSHGTNYNSRKDLCDRGHELCGDNLYEWSNSRVSYRYCKACRKATQRKSNELAHGGLGETPSVDVLADVYYNAIKDGRKINNIIKELRRLGIQ